MEPKKLEPRKKSAKSRPSVGQLVSRKNPKQVCFVIILSPNFRCHVVIAPCRVKVVWFGLIWVVVWVCVCVCVRVCLSQKYWIFGGTAADPRRWSIICYVSSGVWERLWPKIRGKKQVAYVIDACSKELLAWGFCGGDWILFFVFFCVSLGFETEIADKYINCWAMFFIKRFRLDLW